MDFFTNAIILLSLLLICQWTSAKYDCENIKHKKARDSFLDTPKLQIIKNLFQQEDKKLQPTKTPLKEFEDAFKQTINFEYKDNKQIASYFVDEELPDSYSTILYHYEYKNFWYLELRTINKNETRKEKEKFRANAAALIGCFFLADKSQKNFFIQMETTNIILQNVLTNFYFVEIPKMEYEPNSKKSVKFAYALQERENSSVVTMQANLCELEIDHRKYVLHCEERGEKKKDEISTRFEEKEEDEDEGKKLSLNLVSVRAGCSYLKLSYLRQMMEAFFRDVDYRYQLNPKYTKIVVQLEVKKDDEEAIDLYTKCGFIKTLQNVKENIIMKKIVQKKTKETQREITRHCKP